MRNPFQQDHGKKKPKKKTLISKITDFLNLPKQAQNSSAERCCTFGQFFIKKKSGETIIYIHIQSINIFRKKSPHWLHEAACVAVGELSCSVLMVVGGVATSIMPSPVCGTLVFIMCLCKCFIQSSCTDKGPWKTRSQNLRREKQMSITKVT